MFYRLKKLLKRVPFIKPIIDFVLKSLRPNYTYDEDGLATFHNCDFMKDELFIEAYKLGEATYKGSDSFMENAKLHWRVYVVCWAAAHASHMEGDFVECGVNRGWLSRSVIHYVDFARLNKKFYLLDTFEGFSDKYLMEGEIELNKISRSYHYEDCYESVRETFNKFHNVEIIKGPVPETLEQVKSTKVCYLSIDMNCVIPEIAAANFFWDKIVYGGVIILDDYGWEGHHMQKKAFDDFALQKGVKILSLPTGQGLIIKPF
jgi:O-methyltransferase